MSDTENGKNGLTIALPKGRIFTTAMERLLEAGLLSKAISDKSRSLIHDDRKTGARVLILRNYDVPTYVERGAADLGIIGKDVLLEQRSGVYEPLDLRFAPCRLMVAAPDGVSWEDLSRKVNLRIATKFPVIAARYFEDHGLQVQTIYLYGNVEIAPATGVADAVVDLVDSGGTLLANGLTPIREIFSATARLIVNRASLKTKHGRVSEFISSMKKVCKPGKGTRK
ncbi:MAG: ATP phosphoribosyltransferase [Nitrospinota bacterium]|jgi:ATP phosphoribosyltransferase|nr:ATP phosphoribosyltransferase [Nitrospinota bacterium]